LAMVPDVERISVSGNLNFKEIDFSELPKII